MNRRLALALVLSLSGMSFVAAQQPDKVKLQRVHEKLETKWPIAVAIAGRQRAGVPRPAARPDPHSAEGREGGDAKTFLDMSGRAMEAKDGKFEEGINGLAFHPKFKDNGLFYLCYTQQKPKRLVISEDESVGRGCRQGGPRNGACCCWRFR